MFSLTQSWVPAANLLHRSFGFISKPMFFEPFICIIFNLHVFGQIPCNTTWTSFFYYFMVESSRFRKLKLLKKYYPIKDYRRSEKENVL